MQEQRRHQQAAATEPTPPATPSPIGTRVELRFKSKPDLNGQRGVVTAFIASSGRCSVQLEDGRGPFTIEPGNLVWS